MVAGAFVSARPASRIGGWLADEVDVAPNDAPSRAVLAFLAGVVLVIVADKLGNRVPRLGRYGS
jgi:hypothetical protein